MEKETIELVKKMIEDGNLSQEIAEKYCPELKSEDERIRKALVKYLTSSISNPDYEICGIPFKEVLAWLEKQGQEGKVWFYRDDYVRNKEQAYQDGIDNVLNNPQKYGLKKQGEQKSAYTKEYDFYGIKFIPKFAKGDIIKDKKRGEVSTIEDFSYDTGLYTHTYGQFPITIQDNYEIIEHKPAAWSENEGKQKQDVSIQINPSEYINDMGGNGCYLKNVTQASAWSEEDYIEIKRITGLLEGWASTFEKTYYEKECKRGVDWLKSIKDRVQPQPKQEWSEEDEKYIFNITYFLEHPTLLGESNKHIVIEMIEWLKSLRPQKLFTNEEIEQAKKEYRDVALSKMNYIPEELTYDDGWDDAISYMKSR